MKSFNQIYNEAHKISNKKLRESSICIDYADELYTLKDFEDEYDLNFKVISEYGRGGGWPEVKISGSEDEIKRWLSDNYCQDSDVDEDFDLYSIED